MEEAYKTLKEKHSGQFDIPKLRLWSWMICSGLHEDYEKPPKVPMQSPKKSKSSQKKASENSPAPSPECSISLSPSKTVDLRMKNLQQLRYLRQLLDDNILTAEEYQEQKLIIITALR